MCSIVCVLVCTCHSHLNEESESEKLLSALQSSFKAIDQSECGFIASSQLVDILTHLRQHRDLAFHPFLASILRPDHDMDLARLRGLLQVDGEIILWSNFWIHLSQLLSGTPLDALIDRQSLAQASAAVAPASGPSAGTSTSIPAISGENAQGTSSQGFNADPFLASSDPYGRPRSDSEVARELQAQFDSQPFDSIPMQDLGERNGDRDGRDTAEQGRLRSDSELARELQAQWDAESNEVNMLLGVGDQTGDATGGNTMQSLALSAPPAVAPPSSTDLPAASASAGALLPSR